MDTTTRTYLERLADNYRDCARAAIEHAAAHRHLAKRPDGSWAQHATAIQHRQLANHLARRAAHYRQNALAHIRGQ